MFLNPDNFTCDYYKISDKRFKQSVKIVSLADIHYAQYGPDNDRLIEAVAGIEPDVITIPGDILCVKKYPRDLEIEDIIWVEKLIDRLSDIAPVLMSLGNHEKRLKVFRRHSYDEFKSAVKSGGGKILSNRSVTYTINGNKVRFTGVDIARRYYRKGRAAIDMDYSYLEKILPPKKEGRFEVLLAHNPAFFPQYARRGSELILSGHTHGCLVRIPGIGGVISPELKLFPKYDAGVFREDSSTMIVSRGLGTHTFNIRVFDPPQIVTAVVGDFAYEV